MSIEAVTWALGVPVGGNQKVMLLGLANHAHPDGTNAYPSLDTLAKYGACDRATVRRNLRKLVADGWVGEDGKGPRGQTKYRLALGVANCNGLHGGGEGVAFGPLVGGEMQPEPSEEPSEEPSAIPLIEDEDDRRARAFLAWYREETKRRRGRAVSANGDWLRAAREVVVGRPGDEIRAVVLWGLDRGWWYRKINTLPKLARVYPDLRAEWVGELARTSTRNGHAAPPPTHTGAWSTCMLHSRMVRYEGDQCPQCVAEHEGSAV